MRKFKMLYLLFVIVCLFAPLHSRQFARWYTTMGNFTADLRDEIVPITATNFINLTNSGFYNGLHFHRVVAGFVIQDGCPYGTGYGGPGYTIQDEFSPLLHHDSAGVLAMARTSAPNSAGSQYYITLAPTPHLDGNYAIFGKVFEGLDVVLAIGQVQVDTNNHPVTNVNIDSLKVLDLIIYNVAPSTDSTVDFDSTNPTQFLVEAFNSTMDFQIAWYIDDVLQPQLTDIIAVPVFTNIGLHTLKCIVTTNEITWPTIWQVNVLSVANSDDIVPAPDISAVVVYPNPAKDFISVRYQLKQNGQVTLILSDCKGRQVFNKKIAGKTGMNAWTTQTSDSKKTPLAAGLYFLKVETPNAREICKAVLIK
ncbi:MAG: peptidylprolyl isomerase [Candidatus Cloacimonetes bacterium]|nr:peptidylprolyl isomerase [Candidatus Cloacimonadota bacterium]